MRWLLTVLLTIPMAVIVAQETTLLIGSSYHFMPAAHTQRPGLDIGLRQTLQPTRANLSIGVFHVTRGYTAKSIWSGSYLRSTDVTLRTIMPQMLFGYRCTPSGHDRSTVVAQLGMDILVPYHAKFVRHFSDGTMQETDDAPVDYQTGFAVRSGVRYVRSVTRTLRASIEIQASYMVVMNYVEGYDKFNSGNNYNLTTDRTSISVLLGLGFSGAGRSSDPGKDPH